MSDHATNGHDADVAAARRAEIDRRTDGIGNDELLALLRRRGLAVCALSAEDLSDSLAMVLDNQPIDAADARAMAVMDKVFETIRADPALEIAMSAAAMSILQDFGPGIRLRAALTDMIDPGMADDADSPRP